MNKFSMLTGSALLIGMLAACNNSAHNDKTSAQNTIIIQSSLELPPTKADGANMPVLVLHKTNIRNSVILATDETSGIGIYTLDGTQISAFNAGDATSIDVRYNINNGTTAHTLVGVLDGDSHAVRYFSFNTETYTAIEVTANLLSASFGTEGMCLFQNPNDGNLYSFVVGADGKIDQNILYWNESSKLESKNIRQLTLGSEVKYCVANDLTGSIYFSEKEVGVWRLSGDPETDALPDVIDIVKFGNITGEVGGLTLQYNSGATTLIVSNASDNTLNIYDVENDHKYVGSFAVGGNGTIDSIEEAGGLFASSQNFGAQFPSGLLIISDDDNGDENVNYKVVSWADVVANTGVKSGTAFDPRSYTAKQITTVTASFETEPVKSVGDAADDPAIWIHPTHPEQSTIIATDKKGGMHVYDLSGKSIQFLKDGRVNNVDIRYGFSLNGSPAPIVTASNRTTKGISIYTINQDTRELVNIADGIQNSGMDDPYGQCMYKSPKDNAIYVFINDTDGIVRQFRLVETTTGKVSAKFVREFAVGSQTEGCVADDEAGQLFIGEENVAIWKYGAEPDAGDDRILVALIEDTPGLTADVEGMSIYYKKNGEGYLVVSSQGSNTYALFNRKAPHKYIGSFSVVTNGKLGIDGSSETDGIDVTSAYLGPKYPNGIFIAQDGRNVFPFEKQNFKVVNWDNISQALDLK